MDPHDHDLPVRVADRSDAERAIATLALAFADDPVTRWAFPEPAQHLAGFAAFAAAFGGPAFEHGSAFVGGAFAGAALWLAPGVGPDEGAVVAAFERFAPRERLPAGLELMEKMGGFHPAEPHWYLPLIGVDPAQQGRGLGARLLRRTLALVDRERLPAYLESTNPANLSLYRRHGFEVVGTIRAGDAPPVYAMLRAAC